MTAPDRDAVRRWLAGYERAWRERDLDGLVPLFTEDARYRPSPYEPDLDGLDAIRAFWPEDDDVTFTMAADVVAVDGPVAVVRVVVEYLEPTPQQYTDLWLLRFAPDGRVDDFEEWAYWPGRPYSAGAQPL